jgi:ubiquinone/menaquinone biosynthesis C-methylase UbiE
MDALHKRPYWGQFATIYDESADYVVGRTLRLAVAGRLSRERHLGKVLECGCGTGFYTKAVVDHADRVTATDISGEMLDVARHELASCRKVLFLRADADEMPFPPGAFDTVLIANVLNTVKNPLKILQECLRLLKYDGLLVVIVYTDHGMNGTEKTGLALRYFQKFGLPPPWGLNNFSPDELRALAAKAGFTVRTIICLGDRPQALYLRSVKAVPTGRRLVHH